MEPFQWLAVKKKKPSELTTSSEREAARSAVHESPSSHKPRKFNIQCCSPQQEWTPSRESDSGRKFLKGCYTNQRSSKATREAHATSAKHSCTAKEKMCGLRDLCLDAPWNADLPWWLLRRESVVICNGFRGSDSKISISCQPPAPRLQASHSTTADFTSQRHTGSFAESNPMRVVQALLEICVGRGQSPRAREAEADSCLPRHGTCARDALQTRTLHHKAQRRGLATDARRAHLLAPRREAVHRF